MKDRISILEYISILILIILSPFLGIGIYNILKIAKVDSYISIIIGYIMSILLICIFKKINDYKPDLNLKNKIEILFNKNIAFLIITILSICYFLISCILSYNINSFIISQFLSETPILFISIILSILIIYINKKGIEVISRTSFILAILSIILIFIAVIGRYQYFDLSNLKPILKNGIYNPIMGSIYCFLINSINIFLLLIIPKNNISSNKKLYKYIFIGLTLSFIIFLIITIYTISTLGINLSLLYHYPSYIAMKEITIFGFIDKIENFIIIHWIFEIFICITLIIYFIYKMCNIKPIITIILNITLYTIIFKNSTLFNYLVTKYIPIISIIILLLILIIYFKIKKSIKTL